MIPTVQAPRFGIVSNTAKCHACKRTTPVRALLVQGGQYRIDAEDDDWYPIEGAALLTYVCDLDPYTLTTWQTAASWVQFCTSRTAGVSYWANTCVHCNTLQGDHYLTEADGPFFPTTPALEALVSLEWAKGEISAVAGFGQSGWLDDLVERCPVVP